MAADVAGSRGTPPHGVRRMGRVRQPRFEPIRVETRERKNEKIAQRDHPAVVFRTQLWRGQGTGPLHQWTSDLAGGEGDKLDTAIEPERRPQEMGGLDRR